MIYGMMLGENYECVSCVTSEGYAVFRTFQGSPLVENWRPVRVERGPIDDFHPALPSDFPWLTGCELIMRRRAVFALRDMLEAGGEILPLATDDGIALFALNVTRVLDALDEERSVVKRFPDSDGVMSIDEYVFHEDVVRDVPFFKLPHYGSQIYVGEPFRQRVLEAGLVGLEFTLLWSPETTPARTDAPRGP